MGSGNEHGVEENKQQYSGNLPGSSTLVNDQRPQQSTLFAGSSTPGVLPASHPGSNQGPKYAQNEPPNVKLSSGRKTHTLNADSEDKSRMVLSVLHFTLYPLLYSNRLVQSPGLTTFPL